MLASCLRSCSCGQGCWCSSSQRSPLPSQMCVFAPINPPSSPRTLLQAKEKITDFVRDVLLAPPAAKGCKVAVVA